MFFFFKQKTAYEIASCLVGSEMCIRDRDNIQMTVTLIQPIAMEEGLRFAIREGGRTVGAGVVSKIIE